MGNTMKVRLNYRHWKTSQIRLIGWNQKVQDKGLAFPTVTSLHSQINPVDSTTLTVQPMIIRNEVTL
jgi:hypothetical protein